MRRDFHSNFYYLQLWISSDCNEADQISWMACEGFESLKGKLIWASEHTNWSTAFDCLEWEAKSFPYWSREMVTLRGRNVPFHSIIIRFSGFWKWKFADEFDGESSNFGLKSYLRSTWTLWSFSKKLKRFGLLLNAEGISRKF